MLSNCTQPMLLSQATGWWDMGRQFREGGSAFAPTHLLIVLSVVAGLTLLLWMLAHLFHRDDKKPYRSPRRLFGELCRAHELNLLDRWLLWRLARLHNLDQPAAIFLSAHCFAPQSIPDSLSAKSQRIEQLRERLFS